MKSNFFIKTIGFFVTMGLIIAGLLFVVCLAIYPKLPSMDDLRNYRPKLPLQIYSEDNVLLGQFGDEKRIYLPMTNTPKMLINAILAAEDTRFYEHGGIDIRGLIRAIVADITTHKLQSGASTITMQVARNFFLTKKKTFSRKFYEALLAYKIEQELTKNQILELYTNQIYLGQRAYGFAEASIIYFAKPIDKLTIAQYAVLAGLPKAPSSYNPVVNKKRSKERELYVLNRMYEAGFITNEEYNQAISEPIITAKVSNYDNIDNSGYIAEMVRQMMYDKYGDKIYSDGYKVYTSINSKMQQAAYNALRKGLLRYTLQKGYTGAERQLNINFNQSIDDLNQDLANQFDLLIDFGDIVAGIVMEVATNQIKVRLHDGSDIILSGSDIDIAKKFINRNSQNGIRQGSVIRLMNNDNKWSITQLPEVEGAIIALNPNNGMIKALVGGFDFTRNKYNHVTQALRQPGSGFKPFIYSASLDAGFSPNTIVQDTPVCFSTGNRDEQWCPKNDISDHGFSGAVTIRQALSRSLNVPVVKVLNQIKPQYTIDYITKFGFDKDQFQPYLTLSLGVNEVTPLQMAVAYSVFANGGYLVSPYVVTKIIDDNGNILAQTKTPDIKSESTTIQPRNAYIMNSMLQDSIRYGTGARVYKELKRNDMAGKTGTTSDGKDTWFDGYTPNLVAITWVGYDQPKSLGAKAYGASISLPIWLDFMHVIINDIPEVQLPMPDGIAVIQHSTWKGNDEYVYANESFINNLSDNAPNETIDNNLDKNDNNDNTNDDNKNSGLLDSLIKKLF
jgi:penicillin-binding protein 1A